MFDSIFYFRSMLNIFWTMCYVLDVLCYFWLFGLVLGFWILFLGLFMSKTCFLSFSTQNHAESFRHFVKISVLNQKCVEFKWIKTLISVKFYVFFGRIRAAVPNLSSAGFGRPSQI